MPLAGIGCQRCGSTWNLMEGDLRGMPLSAVPCPEEQDDRNHRARRVGSDLDGLSDQQAERLVGIPIGGVNTSVRPPHDEACGQRATSTPSQTQAVLKTSWRADSFRRLKSLPAT